MCNDIEIEPNIEIEIAISKVLQSRAYWNWGNEEWAIEIENDIAERNFLTKISFEMEG